jgi:hypothetical protein
MHKKFKVLNEVATAPSLVGTITNDPEDVGYWDKTQEINEDLKKMMEKWYGK